VASRSEDDGASRRRRDAVEFDGVSIKVTVSYKTLVAIFALFKVLGTAIDVIDPFN